MICGFVIVTKGGCNSVGLSRPAGQNTRIMDCSNLVHPLQPTTTLLFTTTASSLIADVLRLRKLIASYTSTYHSVRLHIQRRETSSISGSPSASFWPCLTIGLSNSISGNPTTDFVDAPSSCSKKLMSPTDRRYYRSSDSDVIVWWAARRARSTIAPFIIILIEGRDRLINESLSIYMFIFVP